jgi:hypothetical protein
VRGTTSQLVVERLAIPSAADLSQDFTYFLSFGTSPTVVGETIANGDLGVWIEADDGLGTVVHNFARGGDVIEYMLGDNESGIVIENQFVDSVLHDELELRAHRREMWILLDIGTNGPITTDASRQAAQVERFIERLRTTTMRPDLPVILRSAYPGEGDTETRYNQVANRIVAERLRNVMAVDTYAASYAGGGYEAAVAKGWFGAPADTVHRNRSGRIAFENMFEKIISGASIAYSPTCG